MEPKYPKALISQANRRIAFHTKNGNISARYKGADCSRKVIPGMVR